MGRGKGAGYPLTLRCAKCKKGAEAFEYGHFVGLRDIGTRLEATGRIKDLLSSQYGRGCGRRSLQYRAEYKCLDCGHVGWSRHHTMEFHLRKLKEKSDDAQ